MFKCLPYFRTTKQVSSIFTFTFGKKEKKVSSAAKQSSSLVLLRNKTFVIIDGSA